MGDTLISSLKVSYNVHKFPTEIDRGGKRLMMWNTRIKLTLGFMGNIFRLLFIVMYFCINCLHRISQGEVSVCVPQGFCA